MEHSNPNPQPLRAIENVIPSKMISPEKSLLYNRYMKKAREAAEAGRPKDSLELLKKAAAIQKTDKVMKRIAKVEAFLADNSDSEEEENSLIHVGKGFHLTKEIYDNLYPYQRESLLWFWRLHRKGKGGILGDDMGLGKTIQVVAFLTGLLDMQQARSVLIVLPVAVIINWEREFEKWAPGINLQCFHGSSKRDKERALSKVQRRGGVLLTSYGLVLTSFQQMIQSDGREFVWDYIVLDEGHKIKNPGKTTKAVHSIPARHRFILTGTPIQNNLKEMWALFDFVTHGSILGTIKTFMMEYGNPITRARERDATSSEKLLGNEMAESLRNLIHPYFLRRTKADVLEGKESVNSFESSENEGSNMDDNKTVQGIPRLTRKNDFIIWLYLTETQIQIYKDFSQLDQVKELLMSTRSPLAELTVLKKLCDHPRLLSARACQQLGLQTTESIEEDSEGEDGSSVVTDSHSTGCNIQDIDDDILIAESGKLQFLLELLHNLTEEGHRTLVFSQSRKMLDIVEKILRNQNFKFMRLDGTVSKLTDREQRIKCFQSNESYSIFLLTTQVGGVGLTLTGADRVVIIDPSWNPATDNQAVDRAYRIGQTKAVVIYRLITCGTVEEKIYRRQIFKDSITKQATGASKNPYRYFSRQELRELFILDDPSRSKTQEQLQDMHSAHRKSDTDLDTHIAFLHSLDSMYGISDHDLMFSQEAAREENTGFETETEDYIQKRVQRAQDLVSAESDLTVQLKEQLVINTQAPGLHPHPMEVNTDRTRLRKEWERVHGEPSDVHILKPGADYEERYVSKKTPEPEIEYDLTATSSDESDKEEIIEDDSDADVNIEQESSKLKEENIPESSPLTSRETPNKEPTHSAHDQEAGDVKKPEGWEYVLSLEASPFTPAVGPDKRKLSNSDKVREDSLHHYGDVSSNDASPELLLKDENYGKDKSMMEDGDADFSSHLISSEPAEKESNEMVQKEAGNSGTEIEDEIECHESEVSEEETLPDAADIEIQCDIDSTLDDEMGDDHMTDATGPPADVPVRQTRGGPYGMQGMDGDLIGMDGEDVPAVGENHRDGVAVPLMISPELPEIEINGSNRGEEGLETDAEFHALESSMGREDTSREKEVEEEDTDVTEGLCASHGSKEKNNLTRQQWWQSGGEDQLQPKDIEGAVIGARKSASDEMKETVQNLSHNSCEHDASFSNETGNYSEEELEKDAQDFEMQCDLGSDDTEDEDSLGVAEAGGYQKEDRDEDDYHIKTSAAMRSRVEGERNEDVVGMDDRPEDERQEEKKEEGVRGDDEKTQDRDESKMEEEEAATSLAVPLSPKPVIRDGDCSNNWVAKEFNDSLKRSIGGFASTPMKSPAAGERSLNDSDNVATEREDSLIRPKKRAARIIEDSDEEEEEAGNFRKPSCLVPDSDQSDEEVWHTAKKGSTLSSSFGVEDSDYEMSVIEASFQEMTVIEDSEPEQDEEDMSGVIMEDSIGQCEDETDDRKDNEMQKGKRRLFEQKGSYVERREKDLTNNSMENESSRRDGSNQQNERRFYDSATGGAVEVREQQEEGEIEVDQQSESDNSLEEDEERYACSEDLDDADREIYYHCIEKAESYLQQGRKLKALRSFLKALNIDSYSEDLQLQTVTLAREVKSTEQG